jgi:hypothetical protein
MNFTRPIDLGYNGADLSAPLDVARMTLAGPIRDKKQMGRAVLSYRRKADPCQVRAIEYDEGDWVLHRRDLAHDEFKDGIESLALPSSDASP